MNSVYGMYRERHKLIERGSEYFNFLSPRESHIVVNCQDEHVGTEESGAAEEMPDIVTVIEIQPNTISVQRPKLEN